MLEQVEFTRARTDGRSFWLTMETAGGSREVKVSEATYRRTLLGLPDPNDIPLDDKADWLAGTSSGIQMF